MRFLAALPVLAAIGFLVWLTVGRVWAGRRAASARLAADEARERERREYVRHYALLYRIRQHTLSVTDYVPDLPPAVAVALGDIRTLCDGELNTTDPAATPATIVLPRQENP